ncbi:hypothetical protein, partial [Vibrio anguillarum]|uniref:hypothetical protein n=2 Tax=Vibrio anguillarum TaxID=55601 RepID=UPI003D36460E
LIGRYAYSNNGGFSMADIATFGAALSSIKTAIDLAKVVKDSDLTLEKAETKLKLAELLSALADAKMELVDIQELIAQKDSRIKELEDSFALKDKLIRHGDAVYQVDEMQKPVGEPYCLSCWSREHKAFPLHQSHENIRRKTCSVCKSNFDKRYVPVFEPQA